MRRVSLPALLLLALLVLLPAAAKAQKELFGVIRKATYDSVQMVSGDSLRRAPKVSVTLLGGRSGLWTDLNSGDRVRYILSVKRLVLSIVVTGKVVLERDATPLAAVAPVEGHWSLENNAIIHGRVFENACVMHRVAHAVFTNTEGYDLFEAWVGKRSGTDPRRELGIVFLVQGDGEEIYQSPKMKAGDPPLKISVPIKNYKTITLRTRSTPSPFADLTAIWADPVLVKLPTRLALPIAPPMNARIVQNTMLLWRPVSDAKGYLLELQCVALDSPSDADSPNRFLTLQLPPQTTSYDFDITRMPKGKWQWRVHALSDTGFLDHTDDWSLFYAK